MSDWDDMRSKLAWWSESPAVRGGAAEKPPESAVIGRVVAPKRVAPANERRAIARLASKPSQDDRRTLSVGTLPLTTFYGRK